VASMSMAASLEGVFYVRSITSLRLSFQFDIIPMAFIPSVEISNMKPPNCGGRERGRINNKEPRNKPKKHRGAGPQGEMARGR